MASDCGCTIGLERFAGQALEERAAGSGSCEQRIDSKDFSQ